MIEQSVSRAGDRRCDPDCHGGVFKFKFGSSLFIFSLTVALLAIFW